MSASNKKELHKQETASAEAKKTKVYTMSFWVVIVLCVCITLGSVLVNPVKNVIYKNTVAVQVGDYEVNAVELNYFYVDAINNYIKEYNSTKGYDFILTRIGGNMLYANEALDITKDIVDGLNALYDSEMKK